MRYVVALLLILLATSAWSASGDWYVATANYDEGDWTNTDSIYASDDRRAANAGTNSHRVGGKGFGVAVPTNYVPWKIVVSVEGNCASSVATRKTVQVQLSKDGGATGVGDIITCTLKQTTDTVMTINGSTNTLWGTTWTEAEIENANFTVNVRKVTDNAAVQSIDQIKVQVYYKYSGTKAHFILGRDGYGEAIDAKIVELAATTNYGTGVNLVLGGVSGVSGANNILMGWGRILTDSIVGRTCDSVKLTFYNGTATGFTASPQFSFYTLRRKAVSVSQTTWNIFKTDSNWTTAGAGSTTSDIWPTAHNTFAGNVVGGSADFTVYATDAFKVCDGNDTIQGLFLALKQSSGDDEGGVNLASADAVSVVQRLQVELWTTAGHAGGAQSARRRRILGYKENIGAYNFTR